MKKVLLVGICVLLCVGTVDANLSDGFFCQVKSEEVVISLKKTEGFYRCKDTIVSLESLILQTAQDLMTIQTYINKGRDVDYWVRIKNEKLNVLDRFQLARKNIIENMQTFENNLVIKAVHYFILSITPYKVNIQRSLVKIDAMTGQQTAMLISYSTLLKEQIKTIELLSQVETIDALIPLFNTYLYLKKEISGKYE